MKFELKSTEKDRLKRRLMILLWVEWVDRVDWAKQVDWFKSQKAITQLGWKAIKKCCEELKIEEVRMRSGEVS
jgi:hypothetical protein